MQYVRTYVRTYCMYDKGLVLVEHVMSILTTTSECGDTLSVSGVGDERP